MPWEKVTNFKEQVKVGDKIRSAYFSKHGEVTAIGVTHFLAKFSRYGEQAFANLFGDSCEVYRKPKRWVPEIGERYWGMGLDGRVLSWTNYKRFDARVVEFGSAFRTREQAEEAAKRIRQTLHDYHEELLKEEDR